MSPLVANGSVSDMAEDPLVRVEQLLREATRLLNDYRLEHDLEAARRTPITGRQLGVLVKVAQQHGESGVTQGELRRIFMEVYGTYRPAGAFFRVPGATLRTNRTTGRRCLTTRGLAAVRYAALQFREEQRAEKSQSAS